MLNADSGSRLGGIAGRRSEVLNRRCSFPDHAAVTNVRVRQRSSVLDRKEIEITGIQASIGLCKLLKLVKLTKEKRAILRQN